MTYCTSTSCLNPCLIFCHANHCFVSLIGLAVATVTSPALHWSEHLFFFKLIGDTPIDTFLMEMLEAPHQMT
ncbi:unnamed protein product [Oncorhynchus mykiss]|uniref:Uncharacterized protein n=1 Tax=Oncorhynchus mykiss TaxID=8022 RepID=A0A060XZ31_ONCMY|nr:unnamed protein product [Oncorhynchus mykiss]